jgi:2-polyprenyl-3-methyl-5-hydroxy-6-metoxy-1,4-benzoquinol methylase
MNIYSTCPVCGSSDFKEVLQARDYTVSKEMFGVCHCNGCQHRFTNPVPTQAEIGPYYKSEDYVSHTNTSKGFIHRLYQLVRKQTLKSKRQLLQRETGKKQGKHLDVGSGAGAFLATMQNAGWDCLGLEPDADARMVAERDFGVKAKPTEELFQLEEDQYDAITMWHVLEHVHQLHEYIAKLKSLLKIGGRLFIAVPNYQSYDATFYKDAWAAYDVPRHLYHFCPESMRNLLGQHGLHLVEMRRMPFDSYYVSMLTERNRGGSMLRALWVGWCSYWVALFDVEECSSLIYVIRKSAT